MGPDPDLVRVGSTDGVSLAVHDLGGTGDPLLLAHATGFHGHVLEPLAHRVADTFHAYAVDLRAHGDSTAPVNDRFEWPSLGDDVLAAVDALGLTGAFALGHSGGGAAVVLAEAARPGTFAGLYLVEPVIFPYESADDLAGFDNPLARGALKRRERFGSLAEAYANYDGKGAFTDFTTESLHAYVDHGFEADPEGGVRLKCHPVHEAAYYRMAASSGAYTRLADVTCPVTLVHGGPNGHFTPEVFAAQCERLPVARVEPHLELGHFAPMEDPDAIAASLRRAWEWTRGHARD